MKPGQNGLTNQSARVYTNSLIIFIKNPVLGTVKTRLAESIGEAKALRVYQHLLDKTQQVTTPVNAHKLLFYSDHIDSNDQWPNKVFEKHTQQGHNLGDKMYHALKDALKKSTKVVIVGSDCNELTTAMIEKAFLELDNHDVVLGPAKDGGYYLLGLKQVVPGIFSNVEWSTNKVLRQTIERLDKLSKNYFLLEELNDIDTLQDLNESGLKI